MSRGGERSHKNAEDPGIEIRLSIIRATKIFATVAEAIVTGSNIRESKTRSLDSFHSLRSVRSSEQVLGVYAIALHIDGDEQFNCAQFFFLSKLGHSLECLSRVVLISIEPWPLGPR